MRSLTTTRGGTGERSPWFTQSQIAPPRARVPALKSFQYSSKPPLLLPMACEYSHWMSGRGSPFAASRAISAAGWYMWLTMSTCGFCSARS